MMHDLPFEEPFAIAWFARKSRAWHRNSPALGKPGHLVAAATSFCFEASLYYRNDIIETHLLHFVIRNSHIISSVHALYMSRHDP